MNVFHRRGQRSSSISILILFVVLLLAFGLSGPPRAQAQGEGNPQPQDLATCRPITFGAAPLTDTISSTGEVDCFTFSGVSNHRIRLRVVKTSGGVLPYYEVRSPNSTVLCPATFIGENDCILVNSGTHTIRVQDFGGTDTGSYSIYIQDLSNPAGCTAVAFGALPLARSISRAAETDCYTFTGVANHHIRLRVVETSGGVLPYYEVVSPDGTVLCPPTFIGENDCVLVNPGRHTILVRDFNGPNTGAYSIYVQDLTTPAHCTAISFGALPLARSIARAAETDCYTFNGAANHHIRVRTIGTSGGLTPYYEVVSPDGTVLCPPTFLKENDCVLVNPGTHKILVRDFNGPNTGSYGLYVQDLRSPVGCTPISFSNLPRSGSIAHAAETDCYTFNGAAGDQVRIRVARNSGALTAYHEVISPDGTVLCSPTFLQEQNCALVNSGRHTILLRDFAGPNTGAYSIAIIFTHTGSYDGWVVRSVAAQDGWILESAENSNVGGTVNSNAVSFQVGDDAVDRQYRAILSFNTAVLPDGATILSVVLKIRQQGAVVGVNPFTTHNGLRVDLRKPFFGPTVNLESRDFQAAGTLVGQFNPTPAAGWYSATFNATGKNNINKTGPTQIRLRFGRDDDDDRVADLIRFFSGSSVEALRPILIIKYLP